MRNKRLISYVLFFLLLTILLFPILTDSGIYMRAQAAATQGLNEKELLLYVGNTYTLKLKGKTVNAKWSSSNKSVAEVSSKGKVKAKKKGTATITATVGSKKYKCKVTVDKVTLNHKEATLKKGKTLKLSMINSKKKVVAEPGKVKWSSSDPNIASVDSKGIVYPKEIGTATITGTTNDGMKAVCKVNVPGVRFINRQEYLEVGETIKLEYIYIPPEGKKNDLFWTIDYDISEDEDDICGELPLVPYSFDQESATLTALRSARLIEVMLESKSDPNICDSYLIEFVGVHVCTVTDRYDDEYSDYTDYTDNYEDDLQTEDDDNPVDSNPIDYDYLARYSKPTLKTSERFIIDKDCSVTIYDAPIFYLPSENWDIWEKFYYTVDGTTPTMNSTRFSSNIYLEQDCTLKMVGVSGDIISEVLTINIKLLCDFYLFWGTNPVVDNATVMYAIKNNVSDLSVLNEKELELYYKAKQILEEIITPGMTDHDKLKAIHDYICRNVTYEPSPNDQDAYGAFVLNRCVCTGYANAFQLLAGLCDIHTMKINGVAGGPHFWNLVKLDGEWYHVDCGADDVDSENRIHYRFFLIDDSHFGYLWYKGEYTDIFTGRTYAYPLATSTKYFENIFSENYLGLSD